ncbi:ComEC/Rec2 family competence protein, partial [Chloroflexota bacterium]
SILLEASDVDAGGARPRFALIDSNDNADKDYWPAWNFLRKHFGLREHQFDVQKTFFDMVILTHDHSDHGSGLKRIMKRYGTEKLWYPKVDYPNSTIVVTLQNYANHHLVNIKHQDLDSDTTIGNFGDATLDVLWPPPDTIASNPNNNSIVLSMTLHGATFLLTGDAEGEVWQHIAGKIPPDTRMLKVPHHGSKNGTLHQGGYPWVEQLDTFQERAHLGISCHPNFPNRYDFPDQEVLGEFDANQLPYYRTDMHYHITFTADQNGVYVRYSH